MRGKKFDVTRRANKEISQSTTQAAILSPVGSLIGILDFAMALLRTSIYRTRAGPSSI